MPEREEEDTETKLGILASIFTGASYEELLDILIKAEGNIERSIALQLDSSRRPTSASFPGEPPLKRPKIQPSVTLISSSTEAPIKSLNTVLKWTPAAEPPGKVLRDFHWADVGATSNT